MSEDQSIDVNKVPVVDTHGNIGQIDISQLPDYQQKYGVKVVPESTWQEHLVKQEFENKPIQAGLFGLAQGAFLGLPAGATRLIGGEKPAEYLHNLEQYNPGITLGANVVGATIPALLTGGESALESGPEIAAKTLAQRVAGYTPAGALAKGAQSIHKAIENLPAIEALSKAGLAGEMAANIIPRATALGAESIPYGMGHALSEDMLGDPDINASKLMAHMTLDGILTGAFGAVLGATFGVGATILPKIGAKFSQAADSMGNYWQNLYNKEAGRISETLEGPEKEAFDNFYKIPENIEKAKMSDFERQSLVYDKAKEMKTASDNFLEWNKKYESEFRPAFNKILSSDVASNRAYQGANDIIDKSNALLNEVSENPQAFSGSVAKTFEDRLRYFQNEVQKPGLRSGDIYELQREFNQSLKFAFDKKAGTDPQLISILDRIKGIYRDNVSSLTNEDIWGPVASFQKENTALNQQWLRDKIPQWISKYVGPIKKDPDGFVTEIRFDPKKIARNAIELSTEGSEGRQAFDAAVGFMKGKMEMAQEMEQLLPRSNFNIDKAYETLGTSELSFKHGMDDLALKKQLASLKTIPYPEGEYTFGNLLKRAGSKLPFVGKAIEQMPSGMTPYSVVNKLYDMRRVLGGIDGKIDSLVSRFKEGKGLTGLEELLRTIAVPATSGAVQPIFEHGLIHGFQEALKNNDGEELNRLNSELAQIVQNPQMVADQIHRNLEAMGKFAPMTKANIMKKTMGSLQLLNTHALKDRRSSLEQMISDGKWQPSDMEKHDFSALLNAVNNPLVPMGNMLKGQTSTHDLAVMGSLHSGLLDLQKRRIASYLADSKAKLGYDARVKLGNYFGLPTESSLDKRYIRGYSGTSGRVPGMRQAPMGMPQVKQPKARTSGLNKMTFSQRSSTPMHSLFKE